MLAAEPRQQQEQEEFHQRTVEALNHAYEKRLTMDDLQVLCYHCGVPVREITHADHERR